MTDLHPIVDQEGVRPSEEQKPAVVARGRDVAVTAGAGAGKTRTLVARYLSLLAERTPLRSIVAITFTRKAAREMRNRVRRAIRAYLQEEGPPPDERAFWDGVYGELDAARIGTIHQLCSEILRAHPAEAAVDPRFDVLDEAQAVLLQAEAVDDALAWAGGDDDGARLFALLGERALRDVLLDLLARRLDAETAFAALPEDVLGHWRAALEHARRRALDALLADDGWQACLERLRTNEPVDADDRMAVQRAEMLAAPAAARRAETAGEAVRCLATAGAIDLRGGSQKAWPHGKEQRDEVKEALRGLRDLWRERKGRLTLELNGMDEALAAALPALEAAYRRALAAYARLKEERQALDFDDLEQRALELLADEDVRRRWRSAVRAILVDEYQDTNARQRDLVNALNGGARLFIVGDAKQSIYRFRGADVTVFRRERQRIEEEGLAVSLSHSYRAHRELIADLNALLAPVLGEEDPYQPWREPFAPLKPVRQTPDLPLDPPHVALHLTVGSKGDGALKRAAAALAGRLREMAARGLSYEDVAVLCRASTSFADYEDAFDEAAIPYLTVAGRGFYERPEIRDLLNALSALTDPTEDLALAGLLRSPVFGFSDEELWELRLASGENVWWEALQADAGAKATRAVDVIQRLHKRAGRLPVADLLKAFLDETDYRAALHQAGQPRAARNVDKLLAGAHASGIVSAGEFLEYVENLRTGRAREGEAQATAEGAVRIMTVHAAKGLEFPVVVLGDVNYGGPGGRKRLLLHEEWGVLPPLQDEDEEGPEAEPAIYRLAKMEDALQEAAEQDRLLYVAATRAEEILILNGCIGLTRAGRPGWLKGWLGQLAPHIGLKEQALDYDEEGDRALPLELAAGSRPLGGVVYEPEITLPAADEAERLAEEKAPAGAWSPRLVEPLAAYGAREKEAERERRVWRVVPSGERARVPAWVVGSLVHEALARWRFPNGDKSFGRWAQARARHYGLTVHWLLEEAMRRTTELLDRLKNHELYADVEGADRRLHEVPYSLLRDGELEQGAIDLLYRRRGRWTVVDFKTDRIENEGAVERVLEEKGYRRQLARYMAAVEQLLGERPRGRLCFLDVDGDVLVKNE